MSRRGVDRALLWAGLVVVLSLLAGCDRSSRSLHLDQPKAREVVNTVLTAWREGKKPADLKPVIVGDHDWDLGKSLVSFVVADGETNDGTNLHIPVMLVLKDATGKETKSEAIYTVGTSPVVTMIRETDD